MSNTSPQKRWLTYGEVKQRIEACIGSSGRYTLELWLSGDEPVLPRHYFPGRKRAAYDPAKVDELLKPYCATPTSSHS
jgi:hypothetical protein